MDSRLCGNDAFCLKSSLYTGIEYSGHGSTGKASGEVMSEGTTAVLIPFNKITFEFMMQFPYPFNAGDAVTQKAQKPFIKIVFLEMKNSVPVTAQQIHILRIEQGVNILIG